jgi:hypothetical protein
MVWHCQISPPLGSQLEARARRIIESRKKMRTKCATKKSTWQPWQRKNGVTWQEGARIITVTEIFVFKHFQMIFWAIRIWARKNPPSYCHNDRTCKEWLIWARRRRWSPISGLHWDRLVIVILINSIFICVSFGLVWACPTKLGCGLLVGRPSLQ